MKMVVSDAPPQTDEGLNRRKQRKQKKMNQRAILCFLRVLLFKWHALPDQKT
jgi:hypothetical protein